MKIVHANGTVEQFTLSELQESLDAADDKRRAVLENLIRTAELMTHDDRPITGATRQRLVARCLGTYDHIPRPGDYTPSDQSWLVPELWPWGTKPMLGGNPKAGKTTVITDLAVALVKPGYRFLGHFDPVPTTTDEYGEQVTIAAESDKHPEGLFTSGVWVVNAETPAAHFERAIERGLGRPPRYHDYLTVDHLEAIGGARAMDLTNPDTFDEWVHRLGDCNLCEGEDDWVPTTVVVDGLTAILAAAGKGPEAYGLWYARFRELLNACDVPNGLVTAHNTMTGRHLMGGVEAGAGPDGLWNYSSTDPDRDDSPRRFSVVPRLGGIAVPPTRVVLGAGGRPVIEQSAAASRSLSPGRIRDRGPSATGHSPELSAASLSPGEDRSSGVVTFDLGDDPEDSTDADLDTDVEDDGQQADTLLAVAERVRAFVQANPGADGQQITDAVNASSKGLDWRGRTEAIRLGWIREEKCSRGCLVCSANSRPWHNNRRHFFAV